MTISKASLVAPSELLSCPLFGCKNDPKIGHQRNSKLATRAIFMIGFKKFHYLWMAKSFEERQETRQTLEVSSKRGKLDTKMREIERLHGREGKGK